MERKDNQTVKGSNKINYQQKNLNFIQKIKEKKLKEEEERLIQEKKQQQKRQKLKRKILEQASKNRQNRQSKPESADNSELDSEGTPLRQNGYRRRTNFDSLPKIQASSSKEIQQSSKTNYKDRYMSFLKNLHHNVKSKKQNQEQQKRKKQQRYAKIKQQLGFANVQSKIAFNPTSKPNSQQMARSHSAEKFESLMQIAESQMPKTNKNFKKKNQEYIEKIKKKRQQQAQAKQQERMRKEKLKNNLKDFVMTTVKQNVLDGCYDDQFQKKNIKKLQNKKESKLEDEESQEEIEQEEQSEDKKKKRKMRSFPYVTDLVEWKKKNRIEPQDKVFIITGGYGQLKKALKQRGWYQNPSSSSPCFDLKYTLQGREINYDSLQDYQLVNHFQKAGCLTTKIGLTKSLRNLIWIKDMSEDNFYPKCYDLNDQDDNVGFEMHFKICKALSILKIYSNFVNQAKLSPQMCKKNKQLIQDLKLRTQVAILVCKKNIEDIDQIIDRKKVVKIVTDKEWEILAQDELNEQGLAKKKHEEWLKLIDCKYNSQGHQQNSKQKPESKKKKPKKEKNPNQIKQQNNQQEQKEQDQQELENLLIQQVNQILQEYQKRFPQYHLTHHNNIWILKPAGLSRGRGITCYNNLVQIQDHIKCKQSQWIAQKYIQNPLVVLKRKFDIRQWVLITDFNPLTIWFYEECYIRFSAVDYDPKQVSNKFIHLTNNSIGSHHKRFQNSHIKGNMFFQDQFVDYLQDLEGYDVFNDKIRQQMKDIVKYSMMCGMEHVQNRKKTHQLYGYDFMVDEDFKVWLIEINSSPSMDYSTHVTSRLVKECLHDIVKVIVDYAQAPKKQKKQVDTGKWKKIYKGIEIPDKPISTGLNLCLEGVPMKKPKRNTVKMTNFSLDKKNK